jgi:hypothetical protein
MKEELQYAGLQVRKRDFVSAKTKRILCLLLILTVCVLAIIN